MDNRRRDKAARNKIVVEDICDTFHILFVWHFTLNSLDVFGASKNDVTGLIQML